MGCSFPLVDSTVQANRCSLRTALGVGRAWRHGAGKVAGDWQGGGVQDSAPSSGWTVTLQTTRSLRPHTCNDRSDDQHIRIIVQTGSLNFWDSHQLPSSLGLTMQLTVRERRSRWPSVLYDLQCEPGLLCSGSDQLVFGRVSRVSGILFRLIYTEIVLVFI